MNRTTVFLTPQLQKQIKSEAKKTGEKESVIIRRALEDYFKKAKGAQ
jgi:predicted transcriptional regulator